MTPNRGKTINRDIPRKLRILKLADNFKISTMNVLNMFNVDEINNMCEQMENLSKKMET